ncbi:MAG: MotA/TolQ/ExbB proton channel family protein [Kiritimatiellia bacterium]
MLTKFPTFVLLFLASLLPLQAQTPVPEDPAPATEEASPAPGETTADADADAEQPSEEPPASVNMEIIKRIRSAGRVGALILIMSVVSLGVALSQMMDLRRKRVTPEGLLVEVKKAVLAGKHEEAMRMARESPSVLGKVMESVIEHLDFDFTENSMIAGDVASRELKKRLHRNNPILIVSTSATLLGLLGTVIGMIRSFEAVALAGSLGDPSVMAKDISYALVTTAMGLSVALPSLILYHIFRGRIQTLAVELDEQVGDLLSRVYKQIRQGAPHAD